MTTREMNASAMARYVDSVADTARNLEDLGRRIGFYSRDCDTLDAALKKGKSGVVILFDADGNNPEIHHIGEQAKVKLEKGNAPGEWEASYEQMAGKEWDIAVSRSHQVAKAAGPTPTQKPTGDALRAKQVRDSAREKANRLAEYERNERIAAAAKAASDKMWNRSA